ncbi:MAG TPA: hypothetical protein PLK37_03500 [Terricaulis sp.]|nr:hypothetical protein [Terricaulis sp.]
MRALVIAVLLAACAPAAPPEPAPPPSPEAMSQELLAALTPVLSAEIGQPVALAASQVRVMNEWGYVVAQPTQADGAAINWSTTALAERAGEGLLDSNSQTHALLRFENGAWRVLDHAIGPTDAAWAGWAGAHGAPEALFN